MHRVGARDDDAGYAEIDNACYLEVDQARRQNVTLMWRVTRGIRDSSNRNSLWFQDALPVMAGVSNRFTFPTMPTEHTSRPVTGSS